MNRAALCTAAFVFAVLAFFQSPALAGGLSFEERVKAQKAIEQVYWSHRSGRRRFRGRSRRWRR